MTGTISAMFSNGDRHVILKIWAKNGAIFQERFQIEQTTFARVKYLAMRVLLTNYSWAVDEAENYKLISIETKRMIDEEKTLSQEEVKDGDEYLLAEKLSKQQSIDEQTPKAFIIDEKLIENRTNNLPVAPYSLSRTDHLIGRTEFRTDLNRILLALIETSQKLLWYRSDAEDIFKQAEEILSKSSVIEPIDIQIYQPQIDRLVYIGFTEQQARIALKRKKYDLHAAMELLLAQPDIVDNEKKAAPFYTRNGPIIPFRQIRQQYFQPNETAIDSLEEMGFNHDDIVDALRICHNDQSLTCDYLIGNKQHQQSIMDANNEEGLDPNSSMFQAIMENPFIQQTLNNPKAFFVMLQLYENPSSIVTYINDREIGNMFLQISRIYHAERYQMNTSIRS